jgi:hypothetical protein
VQNVVSRTSQPRAGDLSQDTAALPGRARTLVGIVLVVLTLLVGAYYIQDERVAIRSATWPTVWATSDQWLAFLQMPEKPSVTVVEALRKLPPGAGVVFVGPASDPPITPTYFAMSYLAAPRPMVAVFCAPDGTGGPNAPFRPGQTAGAALFYHMPKPASFPDGQQLGPLVTLVTFQEAVDWASYCQP